MSTPPLLGRKRTRLCEVGWALRASSAGLNGAKQLRGTQGAPRETVKALYLRPRGVFRGGGTSRATWGCPALSIPHIYLSGVGRGHPPLEHRQKQRRHGNSRGKCVYMRPCERSVLALLRKGCACAHRRVAVRAPSCRSCRPCFTASLAPRRCPKDRRVGGAPWGLGFAGGGRRASSRCCARAACAVACSRTPLRMPRHAGWPPW